MDPKDLTVGDYFEHIHTTLFGTDIELFYVLKNDVEDEAIIVTYLDEESIRQATVLSYDCLNEMDWWMVPEERKQYYVTQSRWLKLVPFEYF